MLEIDIYWRVLRGPVEHFLFEENVKKNSLYNVWQHKQFFLNVTQ